MFLSKIVMISATILDKWLVGKKSSDSALYSEKWQQEFTSRPTWCDADMALQQMNQ
ncbi:unnamed protein product, partial [Acanthocheilonema viteae]